MFQMCLKHKKNSYQMCNFFYNCINYSNSFITGQQISQRSFLENRSFVGYSLSSFLWWTLYTEVYNQHLVLHLISLFPVRYQIGTLNNHQAYKIQFSYQGSIGVYNDCREVSSILQCMTQSIKRPLCFQKFRPFCFIHCCRRCPPKY